MHLSKGDLRYKIMQKKGLKQNQNGQQNGGDLRNILSRPAQSSMNSIAARDRMPEPKDTKMRYPEPRDGRQHFTETMDGRSLTPVARNASMHIPEYRAGHAPDPRKQHILEMGDGGRSYFEAQNARRPMPEHRPSTTVTRMDSGVTSYSPWTLDSLRRRSPDESLSTSRVLTAPKKDEILPRRFAATSYDDSRTSTYMSKDAFDISRPMSSSLMTKRAPPVGQMKSMTPVTSSLPRSGSFMQKSSYVVSLLTIMFNPLVFVPFLQIYYVVYLFEQAVAYILCWNCCKPALESVYKAPRKLKGKLMMKALDSF